MYKFKPWHELAWGVGIAVAVYVAGELVFFDLVGITDWKEWGFALFSGSIRAAAGAFLALLK